MLEKVKQVLSVNDCHGGSNMDNVNHIALRRSIKTGLWWCVFDLFIWLVLAPSWMILEFTLVSLGVIASLYVYFHHRLYTARRALMLSTVIMGIYLLLRYAFIALVM